ncbi:DUF7601 domain-containing protein [Anaerostipes sp. MSJ-23]|uniref:DUF7601 domain-containing protein n=1 Tax=Anaerostipes sp. MSJ-23 TaxID=2841520 RepID=UPI001C127B51|nr:FctA domain-containing protein [Anaerostipes sp. MSJ-23]MBU5459206.1 hypothetical protein [Anaerostipes sp. MSJ-23]
MNRKKILTFLLAIVMAFGSNLGNLKTVKADEPQTQGTAYTFIKQYYLKAGDSTTAKNPAETFLFGINGSSEEGSVGKAILCKVGKTKYNDESHQMLDVETMEKKDEIPESIKKISIGSVSFDEGSVKTEGIQKEVTITVPDVSQYPSTGYYFYKFKEVQGDTAGVTYNDEEYLVRVAVHYNNENKLEIANVKLFNGNVLKVTGLQNSYSAGRLMVQKVVTGNMSNRNDEFNVKVTFTAPQGKKIKLPIEAKSEENSVGDVQWEGNEQHKTATFKVKAGTKTVFTNIPEGVTYKVEEQKASGYDDPVYKTNSKENENYGTITGGTADEVIIRNNKSTQIDTGVFMTNLPYLLVLAAAVVGFVLFFLNKRHHMDEE